MTKLAVLYEDNHLIAVNKQCGELSQGDETGDEILADRVKAYIKEKYHKPGDVFLGIVHRLDRPVSGVILFARTSKALERLNKAFQERKIEKKYWAIVTEKPPTEHDTLKHYLVRIPVKNITRAYTRPQKDSQEAVLQYELLAGIGTHYLLEVVPQTGRHHQIRVQLAKISCPIKGDVKYGADKPTEDQSIFLHARSLSLTHPVTQQPLTITAPVPKKDIWKMFIKR